ncbi:MAG: hypothetical protein KC766_39235, partial [Myxococcales bacterium]|nr:hypothetical protein [Myxococcales bacterium]
MAKRRTLPPEVPVDALRDHAKDDEALDRIWQRLDEELPQLPVIPARRRSSSAIWVAAAAVLLFGSGVLVGNRLQPTAEATPVPRAEPAPTDRAAGEETPDVVPAISAEPPSDTPPQPEHRLAPSPRPPRTETSASSEVTEAPVASRPAGPPE